jgi:hypothetical protein
MQGLAIEGNRRPGAKYGSPTTSLPRLATSTTVLTGSIIADPNAQLSGHPIPPPAASVAMKPSRVRDVSCRNGEFDSGPRGR